MDFESTYSERPSLRKRTATVASVANLSTIVSNISRGRALSKVDIKLLEQTDQPLKGTIFYILYTVTYSLCFLAARYMYEWNPEMTPFHMLFMRSAFAIFFQVIFVNKNLKKAVWDGIPKGACGSIIIRTS